MTRTSQPRDQSQRQRRYMELVDRILTAVSVGDRDTEMELRAEAITRFRLSHERIDAELYRQLTRRFGGDDSPLRPCGEHDLDIAQVAELSWLVPGFIPANDQTLIYGAAGSGKTLAAIRAAFAVIDLDGFLDHPDPPANLNGDGSVLFIGSDSGAEPIKQALVDLGLDDHPALRGPDKRFRVWAGHGAQGTVNWTASIPDWLRLLKTVQEKRIDLVIIDSAKAVCAQAGLEYIDNGAVGAMLTFVKQVVARHCSVAWLHHDGVLKGAHAGAKSWSEIPSVVHRIDRADRPDQPRSWTVVKTRKGDERSFRYRLLDGRFSVCDGATAAVPADAAAAVIRVLSEALRNGRGHLSRRELIDALGDRFGIASKTVDNALTRLCREVPPRVCRITKGKGNRGFYRLSPRLQEQVERNAAESSSSQPDASNSLARAHAHMGVPMKREGKESNTSNTNGFDLFPTSSLGKSDKFPREKPGKSQESSPGQGSTACPSHMDVHHVRAREAGTPTSIPPVTTSSDPSAAGSAAASRPVGRSDAGSAEPQVLPGAPSGTSEEPSLTKTPPAGLTAAADGVSGNRQDDRQADRRDVAADPLDPGHPWDRRQQHADDPSNRIEDQAAAPHSTWVRHKRSISVSTRSVESIHSLEELLAATEDQQPLLRRLEKRIEEIVAEPPAGGASSGGQGSGDQDHGSAAGGSSSQPKPSAGGGSGSDNQDHEPPAGTASGSSSQETNGGTASAGDQPSGFEPWQVQLLEAKRARPQTPVVMLLPQLTVEPPTLDQATAFMVSPEVDIWMRQAACSPPPAHPLDGELEPWQVEVLAMRRAFPEAHPASLLLKADQQLIPGNVDGRRVVGFFADYDRCQEQRRREGQDL